MHYRPFGNWQGPAQCWQAMVANAAAYIVVRGSRRLPSEVSSPTRPMSDKVGKRAPRGVVPDDPSEARIEDLLNRDTLDDVFFGVGRASQVEKLVPRPGLTLSETLGWCGLIRRDGYRRRRR